MILAVATSILTCTSPTCDTLQAIRPHLTTGGILAFEELVYAKWPGETIAVRDLLELGEVTVRLLPGRTNPAYLLWRANHHQPGGVNSASNASRFATMNSRIACGFKSNDARSSSNRSIRSSP